MIRRMFDPLADFLKSESAGGFALMAAAAAAMMVANSPLGPAYDAAMHAGIAGMSVTHWINDGLMAFFFLLVGLEIKREFASGELATWPRRLLPAFAAAGGMAVPALIYAFVNREHPQFLAGWAIPAATDIAFALAVLSLLGRRVPPSLTLFVVALAILDDLGAVLVIAIFYTQQLDERMLAGMAALLLLLAAMNRLGVRNLAAYGVVGAVLWFVTLKSGVHATIAGVALAFAIPHGPRQAEDHSPLEVLEHMLERPVALGVLPLFGFANAGVSLAGGFDPGNPVMLGAALGLFAGKQVGVFGASLLAIAAGIGEKPQGASYAQLYGASLLCGIGFTMSLFIGLLAFAEESPEVTAMKIGVLAGSLASALAGALVLAMAARRP
jgi:NhaA family Na+:H+ antiporter